MSTAQGISQFYEVAQQRGFVRDFQLRLKYWNVLNNRGSLDDNDFLLLTTATLPSMETTIVTAPFMGLDFNVPGTTKFPGSKAWDVEFYMTQSRNLRDIFIEIMKANFDYDGTSTGNLRLPEINGNNLSFTLVGDDLTEDTVYNLHGTFITKVGDVKFDLTKNGEIQKIPVTISYQYWTSRSSTEFDPQTDTFGF